jgi:ABC-type multidrug transport system fused ATPase/permease subunit
VIAEALGQNYVHHLRLRLFDHIIRMDPRQLQRKRHGALMLRFVGDLGAVRRWVSYGLVRLVVSGAVIVSTLAVLALIAPLLAAAAGALLGLGVLVNTRMGAALQASVRETRRRRARLSANINEKLSRMAVVQAFGRSDQELRELRRQSNALRQALEDRAARIGVIRGVTQGGTALTAATVLVIGILQAADGRTTPGTVAAAMATIGFLAPALKHLGRVYEYFQDARVAREKLEAFLRTPPYRPHPAGLPELRPGPGELRFENVSLAGALEPFSACLPPGSRVAVVGPNGTGKTTLLELAAGLLRPQTGRVLLDGQDMARVQPASLRAAVGIASPDLPLLSGTLVQNLRYGVPAGGRGEVERVGRLCRIDRVLADLPRGKRTRIHEGGRNLSSGQRQRIMLARALMGPPRLLLLDEMDAHLDAESLAVLAEVIRTFRGTVLWITHRAGFLEDADAVWQMEGGQVQVRPADGRRLKVAG